MKNVKLTPRDLTSEEKNRIAEFLKNEFNECLLEDMQITQEWVLSELEQYSLFQAFDTLNGEVYVIQIRFADFDNEGKYLNKVLDEFIISKNGVELVNDFDLI